MLYISISQKVGNNRKKHVRNKKKFKSKISNRVGCIKNIVLHKFVEEQNNELEYSGLLCSLT